MLHSALVMEELSQSQPFYLSRVCEAISHLPSAIKPHLLRILIPHSLGAPARKAGLFPKPESWVLLTDRTIVVGFLSWDGAVSEAFLREQAPRPLEVGEVIICWVLKFGCVSAW